MSDQEKKQIDLVKNYEKKNYEDEKSPDPFKKKESIRRTPTKTRVSSFNREESFDLRKGDTSKRKRVGEKPNLRQIFRIPRKADKQIKRLDLVIRDMYKPKQEVEGIASRISLYAEQL
ncbi:hypothetical protein JTB14_037808 [Gonioctena quinquepunctata]|nr:hypothetical protein JTB14_037808 [Gonioctena quinquepunctata]